MQGVYMYHVERTFHAEPFVNEHGGSMASSESLHITQKNFSVKPHILTTMIIS